MLIDRNPTVIPEQKAPVIVQTSLKDLYERLVSNFAKIMDLQVCSSRVLIHLYAPNASHDRSLVNYGDLNSYPIMFPCEG